MLPPVTMIPTRSSRSASGREANASHPGGCYLHKETGAVHYNRGTALGGPGSAERKKASLLLRKCS